MKKQSPIKQYYKNYKNLIIYWLVGINVFWMIVAIRVFMNYRNIEASIVEVHQQSEFIKQKDLYTKNFLEPYYFSEDAPYFLAHENNRLFPWEKRVRFTIPTQSAIFTNNKRNQNQEQEEVTPPYARRSFLWERRKTNPF